MWDEIRRGAQSVMDEGQRLARATRLKAQIKAIETALGDRLYDLGTRVLDLHRRNELHHYELDQIFVEIQNLQRELRDKQAEVDELLGHGRSKPRPGAEPGNCPDCGGGVRPDDRFCRQCGFDLKGD